MPRGISRIERIFEPIRILLEKAFYHPRIYPRMSRDRRGVFLSKYAGTEAREEGEEDESALANTSSSEW